MEHMSPHVSIDRDAVSAFCQRHHITRLALFGSVLRDDFGPDSDVDGCMEQTQNGSRVLAFGLPYMVVTHGKGAAMPSAAIPLNT
jgi:predicted nucleotidyltransferase